MTARDVAVTFHKAAEGARVDLSGKDLSTLDLAGIDFKAANLSRANLYGVDLSSSNLSGVDLSGAKLDRAVVIKSEFQGRQSRRRDDPEAERVLFARIRRARGAEFRGRTHEGRQDRGAHGRRQLPRCRSHRRRTSARTICRSKAGLRLRR